VVLDGHTLHLELAADVSGAAHAHGLQVEDVVLDEVAGCQLLKNQVQSHHRCALPGFIEVRPSLVWVILTVILLI